ncbi:MOG protein, partial [Rhinopomastus cyanomelas]|nr:MOG protein [Rhinopomastus cyanomelas]
RILLSCLGSLHILQLASGDFRMVGPGHPLQATVGQDVTLPCQLSPGMDARGLEVRWIQLHSLRTVHLHRNGRDLSSEQMPEYAGRTELDLDGLARGILDLRVTGVRPSDDGQYLCTVQDAASYEQATVDLQVAGAFFHNPRPWMAALGVFLMLSIGLMALNALLLWHRRVQSRELGESSCTCNPP